MKWFASTLTFIVCFALLAPPALATEKETRYFSFHYEDRNEEAVRGIIARADSQLKAMGRKLGQLEAVTAAPKITVTIAPNKEAFHEAQLAPGGVDTWVAGTAYPARSVIVLSLHPDDFFELPEIARHEISHIALYRAAGGRHLPRWFDEGLAILFAGERVVSRYEAAASAALMDSLTPLDELTQRFPHAAHRARLAYAVSALFVEYLAREHELYRRLESLLTRVRSDADFAEAFAATFGHPLAEVETTWRDQVASTASWWALLYGSSWLWVVAAFLFLVAAAVTYRRKRARLALWALHEQTIYENDEWPPTPLPRSERDIPDPPKRTLH